MQRVHTEAQARQKPSHRCGVAALAAVRGDRQGDFDIAQPETIGCAALQQRQSLDRLQGTARENFGAHVAGALDDFSRAVDQGPGAAMLRLDPVTAPNAHEYRIVRVNGGRGAGLKLGLGHDGAHGFEGELERSLEF